MDNRDLIRQYVNSGVGIPRYQYDKLNNNNKTSYLKKMEISIENNASNIKYYYAELPEDVKIKAVTKNASAIQYIKNPSPELQLAAVKQNGNAIMHIKNPSLELQLAAVNQNGYAIEYILKKGINPTPEVQLAAVNQNKYTIRSIKNPTPEVQLAAVKQYAFAIDRIKNPSPEAIALHKKLYGG